MIEWGRPRFSGRRATRGSAAALLAAFMERAGRGLLTGRDHLRDRYRAGTGADGALIVSAATALTAFSVGLNRIELKAADERTLEYRVEFRRWAGCAVGMSGLLGLLLAASWFLFDLGGRIDRGDPGLGPHLASPGTAKGLFWAMVVFWGLLWPWLLVALHKPYARKALLRVLRELDA